jgi:hypothetical protein
MQLDTDGEQFAPFVPSFLVCIGQARSSSSPQSAPSVSPLASTVAEVHESKVPPETALCHVFRPVYYFLTVSNCAVPCSC